VRGRKPLPSVLRAAGGNAGHRPINHDEPQPDPLPTDVPEELQDAAERQEWTRTIVPAISSGHITVADRVMAIAHCHYWATWRDQLAAAAKHAHVVAVGKNKYPMANPTRIMANKTFQLLAKVDAELGLTPTSRTRVRAAKPTGPTAARARSRYLNVLAGGKTGT
jgi:P27 family predicted phage terminase small subunit